MAKCNNNDYHYVFPILCGSLNFSRVEIRTNCNVEVTFHNKMKSVTKERADVSLSYIPLLCGVARCANLASVHYFLPLRI